MLGGRDILKKRKETTGYDEREYKFTWYDVNEWAGFLTLVNSRGLRSYASSPWETYTMYPYVWNTGGRGGGLYACAVLTSLNERKLSVSARTREYN